MERDNTGAPEAHHSGADQPVFDAVLYPHRSLSPRGFRLLLLCVGTVSTLASVPFYLMGAYPVVGFFGLDVGLLWLFFRLNYRAALFEERVRLSALDLLVLRTDPRGRRLQWRFNPAWVRLTRDEHEEYGVTRLALVQRGRGVEVGRFLGPGEKASFADAFSAALARARSGPRFEHDWS